MDAVELIEVEPGRWRVKKPALEHARSDLPCPMVISDTMDAVEQVDGKFYTSKSAFRAVGRAHGLTEVGTEKPKPKVRASDSRQHKAERRAALGRTISEYKAGKRPRGK